jgi:ankyrin repeat protein
MPFASICAAALYGDDEEVMEYLEEGVDIETTAGEVHWTPLMWAVEGGKLFTAMVLIRNHANVRFHDGWGETPLRRAIWFGDWTMMKLLTLCGADLTALNKYGETPLQSAVRDRLEIFDHEPLDEGLVYNYTETIELLTYLIQSAEDHTRPHYNPGEMAALSDKQMYEKMHEIDDKYQEHKMFHTFFNHKKNLYGS